jgi:hypothetical protein
MAASPANFSECVDGAGLYAEFFTEIKPIGSDKLVTS